MARAAQNERLFAGQRLLARIHVSAGLVVVDLHGHIHFHAAQGIHDLLEAVEVDLGIVGNGHAGHLRNRLDGKRRTANGVGGVQLLQAIALDLDLGIAVHRHHGDLLVLRVDTREDHGVGAEGIASILGRLLASSRLVGAHEQHVEGAAVIFGRRLQSFHNLRRDVLVHLLLDAGDIGPGSPRGPEDAHEHKGQHAEQNAAALLAASILRVVVARSPAGIGVGLGHGRQHRHSIGHRSLEGRLLGKRLGVPRVVRADGLRMARVIRPHWLRMTGVVRHLPYGLGVAGVVGADRLRMPRIVRLPHRLGRVLGAGIVLAWSFGHPGRSRFRGSCSLASRTASRAAPQNQELLNSK